MIERGRQLLPPDQGLGQREFAGRNFNWSATCSYSVFGACDDMMLEFI